MITTTEEINFLKTSEALLADGKFKSCPKIILNPSLHSGFILRGPLRAVCFFHPPIEIKRYLHGNAQHAVYCNWFYQGLNLFS